ncbi:MAG TPA: R3H domain-containing nucleic acid-binding protein [Candidatus Paceibacterota bacterium]
MERIETVITELLGAMGYGEAEVETVELGGQTVFSIKNVADPRELIGQHGDTIHSIDTLVKKIVEKRMPPPEGGGSVERGPMFLVDVDEYRIRHIKDLQTKAKMMAERARSFQYDVELSPMTAYERLIVHTALQEEPHVKTESQGEGRNRRVVIKYSAE